MNSASMLLIITTMMMMTMMMMAMVMIMRTMMTLIMRTAKQQRGGDFASVLLIITMIMITAKSKSRGCTPQLVEFCFDTLDHNNDYEDSGFDHHDDDNDQTKKNCQNSKAYCFKLNTNSGCTSKIRYESKLTLFSNIICIFRARSNRDPRKCCLN